MKNQKLGYFFIIPTIAFLLFLVLVPVMYTIYLSFQTQNVYTGDIAFCGLKNYEKALNSSEFWNALKVDVIWTASSVILQLIIGLGLALLINKDKPGIQIYRNLLLMPYVVPVIAIALSWRWMLNESYGILTHFLNIIGLVGEGATPLSTINGALIVVVIMAVWRGAPFVMIFYWAALRSIPLQIYEAAKVDGANAIKRFFYVTLPNLRTVTITLLILRTIWTFNYFDLIYLTTNGGPSNGTQHLPILVYRQSIGRLNFGYAAALSVLMVIILMLIISVYLKVSKEEIANRGEAHVQE